MRDKKVVRQEMRARRKALSPAAKASAARAICDNISANPGIHAALDSFDGHGAIAVYLASPDEIDLARAIEAFLERGVALVAPRWNGETYELARLKSLKAEDLRQGPMGISEPKDAEIIRPADVAVWLVPGLAFTRRGDRLGYGGGWYDRLLSNANEKSLKLGVAHAFQLIEELPCQAHDIHLNSVLIPSLCPLTSNL